MTADTAEFCSACHKVHLDVPVNHYRWQRGFNDYDNWQASGISGQGARSFYYPPKPSTCADCHMPLVNSRDPGNHDGKIHSHRFPAANMAVAYVNRDEAQMREEAKFLTSGFITVDIFAASPVEEKNAQLQMRRRAGDTGPRESTTFATGEESDHSGPVFIREVGKVAAPIDAPERRSCRDRPSASTRSCARARSAISFRPARWTPSTCGWNWKARCRGARGLLERHGGRQGPGSGRARRAFL